MLRIGEFSDTFLPVVDGVGRVVQAYAETLSAMGHQVTVVAPMYDTGSRAGFPYELVDFIGTSICDGVTVSPIFRAASSSPTSSSCCVSGKSP